MSVVIRGVRNAFRNSIRTFSIIVILGLAIGLALTMLLAHQAVNQKIDNVKSSVGNTVTIAPAGFSGFSEVNNALSTSQLDKVKSTAHVSSLTETLTGRLTTIGSTQPSFPGQQSQNSNNQTSLTSPVTINTNGGGGGGGRFFVNGGGSLPANFTPPVSITGTTNPTALNGSSLTISSGQAINGSIDNNDAMISANMASKNNLSVGSTFTAYGATLTVKGIFSGSTQAGNGVVIVSLPAEQRLSGQSGDVTNAVATVDSIDNLNSVTSAVKSILGSSADVTNSQTETQDTVNSLKNIASVSLYSLIGAVIAGAVIIFLTMLMIVRERRREIGVLKAIGASNLKVMWQFMTEAMTLTILAAVVGIVLGVVAADPITKTLVNNANSSSNSSQNTSMMSSGGGMTGRNFGGSGGPGFGGSGNFAARGRGLGGTLRSNITNIHAVVGWNILGYGLAAALVIALTGSAVASWFIAKVRPAEVLRTE